MKLQIEERVSSIFSMQREKFRANIKTDWSEWVNLCELINVPWQFNIKSRHTLAWVKRDRALVILTISPAAFVARCLYSITLAELVGV